LSLVSEGRRFCKNADTKRSSIPILIHFRKTQKLTLGGRNKKFRQKFGHNRS
jgi:hypothetical protein